MSEDYAEERAKAWERAQAAQAAQAARRGRRWAPWNLVSSALTLVAILSALWIVHQHGRHAGIQEGFVRCQGILMAPPSREEEVTWWR